MFEREDSTERFYVDARPADDEAVKEGFLWLVGYMTEHACAQGALVMPGVRNIGYLDRILGSDAATALKKNRRMRVADGELVVFTDASVRPASTDPCWRCGRATKRSKRSTA